MSSPHLPEACYTPTGQTGPAGGELLESTRLAAAEWYDDGQHGGTVSALITRAVEHLPSLVPMQVARVTVELFRVVPVAPLEVVASILREGKRIQTSEVRVLAGDTEMARGVVQRLRVTELPNRYPTASPPDRLDEIRPFAGLLPFRDEGRVSFARNAVDVVESVGSFLEPGPATVWFRINVPLVDGEELSPTQRAVISADFSNGLSRLASPRETVFMNSDLTVRIVRPPVGEWVAVSGDSVWDSGGRGVADSRLFDADGWFGTAGQTLYLDVGRG